MDRYSHPHCILSKRYSWHSIFIITKKLQESAKYYLYIFIPFKIKGKNGYSNKMTFSSRKDDAICEDDDTTALTIYDDSPESSGVLDMTWFFSHTPRYSNSNKKYFTVFIVQRSNIKSNKKNNNNSSRNNANS